MSSIGRIRKKTDNRFLNFYEFEAIHRDGRISPYYVSSRAKSIDELKAVTHENNPDGVILYGVYGEQKDHVVLIRQYRYPLHELLLEIPAGKLDHGAEDQDLAARRELSEETGLEAGELIYLGKIYASPGFCTEALHMYLARDLKQSDSHPDEDEFLDVVKMSFDELLEQVMAGEITDAKTVATVLKTKLFLEREKN